MDYITGIFFFAVIGCALGTYFDPCSKTDNKCLAIAVAKFLKASKNGVEGTEVKMNDPFIKNSHEFVLEGPSKLGVKMSDIYVSGLKEQQDQEFNLNVHDNSASLKRKVSLSIVADIKLSMGSDELAGRYMALVNAYVSTKYNYSVMKNPKDNLDYFNVGKEYNVVELIGEPVVMFIEDYLGDQGSNVRKIKSEYNSNKLRYDTDIIKEVLLVSYARVINNLRELAKMLPVTGFFKDM